MQADSHPGSPHIHLRIFRASYSRTSECRGTAESTGAAVPWGHSLSQVRAISCRFCQTLEGERIEVKRLSPVNVPFRVLVFLLIVIGGTVVASRLVTPKKGIACCSAEVCAREHHHD